MFRTLKKILEKEEEKEKRTLRDKDYYFNKEINILLKQRGQKETIIDTRTNEMKTFSRGRISKQMYFWEKNDVQQTMSIKNYISIRKIIYKSIF